MAVENYTKVCNSCLINKNIDKFPKAKTGKYGVRGKCKQCNKEHEYNIAKLRVYVTPDKLKCSKCNIELDCNIENFKPSHTGKYKLTSECKVCLSKRNAKLSKLPKYKEARINWASKNIDKVREYARNTANRNKEKNKAYQKIWYIKNSERESNKNRIWYQENKDRLKDIRKFWRLNNKDKLRTYTSNYKARKESAGSHTFEDIKNLLISQKYKCVVCKCKLVKYDVDHIDPLSKGGSNGANNLQILCPTCNKEKSAKDPIKFMQQKGYLL